MRRYQLIAGRGRLAALVVAVMSVVTLLLTSSAAQASVVNDNGVVAGVDVMPGSTLPAGLAVTATGSCTDPAMAFTPYLAFLPGSKPLCYRGGSVMHANET